MPLLIANWKMHKTVAEARDYFRALDGLLSEKSRASMLFALPYTAIWPMAQDSIASRFQLGAQNLHEMNSGAFTGEISAPMLKEAGASFVLVGHSERRQLFHESDETIASKLHAALASGLKALLCVGETAKEREEGRTEAALERQLAVAGALPPELRSGLMLAYEPVWAIGAATALAADEAGKAHQILRRLLSSMWQQPAKLPIIYGGAVGPASISELLAHPDICGVLVGRASLDPRTFAELASLGIRS